MDDIQTQLISLLEKYQNSNGSFSSLSSPSSDFIDSPKSYTTICTTAYIAYVLSLVKNSAQSKTIQKKSVEFLIKNKSTYETWNYWSNDSPEYQKLPYPDDADDTFAALIALYSLDPGSISGTSLAMIIKGLTAIEKAPGGPYYTWYAKSENLAWRDIDCVVNSQIAHFLDFHSIELPNLTSYFNKAILKDKLDSHYYPSSLHCMYFVSRWYRGEHVQKLSDSILAYFETQRTELTPLQLALGVSSLIRLKRNIQDFESLLNEKLLNLDLWNRPYPWCIDPARDKTQYLSGSPALTLAAALEAYVLLKNQHIKQGFTIETPEDLYFKKTREACLKRVKDLPATIQKQSSERILSALDTTAGKYCITSPCAIISSTKLWETVNTKVFEKICYAQACGWIAYEIWDDCVDENKGEYTGLGLLFYTDMLNVFTELLKDSEYSLDVKTATNQMNTALLEDAFHIDSSHEKSDHWILRKSSGYILGLLCVLHHFGFKKNSTTAKNFITYQQNIIIALQLSDDAHDWQEDIENNQRNCVVDMLPKLIILAPNKREVYFWKTGITIVLEKIEKYCEAAEKICRSEKILKNPENLLMPIKNIRNMCAKTVRDRDTALELVKNSS